MTNTRVTENHASGANGLQSGHFQTNAPNILTSQGELPSQRGVSKSAFNHLNINGVTGIDGHNVSQFENRESANYNSNSVVLLSNIDSGSKSHLYPYTYNPTQTIGEYDSNDQNQVIYTSQAAAYPYQLIDGHMNNALSFQSVDSQNAIGNQVEPQRVLEEMLDLSKVQTQQTILSADTDSDDLE